MTNVQRGIIILIVFALIGWGIYEMRKPWTYSAKAFSGRVVDTDTGEPLVGANVAIFWELRAGREVMGYIEIDETVTDKQGKYSFPAWGPRWRPYRSYLSSGGRSDLNMIVFKTGYKFEDLRNSINSPYQSIREVSWDGKTISLKKFEGNLKDYDRYLMFLSSFLTRVAGKPDCSWIKFESLLKELIELRKKVKQYDKAYSSLPEQRDLFRFDECKSLSNVKRKTYK